MKSDDFYCDYVLNGKIQVTKEIENDAVLAYHHTQPNWPVHCVVVPKKHIASILECDDETLTELFTVIRTLATKIKNKYGACRILTNIGDYQDSKHLHWHLYVE